VLDRTTAALLPARHDSAAAAARCCAAPPNACTTHTWARHGSLLVPTPRSVQKMVVGISSRSTVQKKRKIGKSEKFIRGIPPE
jgi:hypothetical protein